MYVVVWISCVIDIQSKKISIISRISYLVYLGIPIVIYTDVIIARE